LPDWCSLVLEVGHHAGRDPVGFAFVGISRWADDQFGLNRPGVDLADRCRADARTRRSRGICTNRPPPDERRRRSLLLALRFGFVSLVEHARYHSLSAVGDHVADRAVFGGEAIVVVFRATDRLGRTPHCAAIRRRMPCRSRRVDWSRWSPPRSTARRGRQSQARDPGPPAALVYWDFLGESPRLGRTASSAVAPYRPDASS